MTFNRQCKAAVNPLFAYHCSRCTRSVVCWQTGEIRVPGGLTWYWKYERMTGPLPGKRHKNFCSISQIHRTTLRTNVQDARKKKAHFFTDFLRHIHPIIPVTIAGVERAMKSQL
jgi:hypothetical protein